MAKSKKIDWCYIIIGITFACLVGVFFWWRIREDYEQQNDPMLHKLKKNLVKVHPKAKDLKYYKGKKSYTINKSKMYLCLRDENGDYYNDNTLMYVSLHELAHAITHEIGHTQLFQDNFDKLLQKASELGLYNFSIPVPSNYCEYND